MKIKTKRVPLDYVLSLPVPEHKNPKKPWWLLRRLINLLSLPELLATRFSFSAENMEAVGDNPCLILMNHSGFVDLKIAFKIFSDRPFCTVSTDDSFIGFGMPFLMRAIGCIPTHKFVSDITLMSDMKYALETERVSVLLFPEAGYSFDGRATALPPMFGMLLKRLKVPVVTVITDGAFHRQPLYNELRRRKTEITARVRCILTPDEIEKKSISELDSVINKEFSFDAFASQRERGAEITEPDRAEGLERVLYRCPCCHTDGVMKSEGSELYCTKCGFRVALDTRGRLTPVSGELAPDSVTEWYDYERESVRNEIDRGEYGLDTEVDISVIRDHGALYLVGKGRLVHSPDGLTLYGEDGRELFRQSALASHSLNVDFYWYTISDMICIGDRETLYCCFTDGVSVAKARLAYEELYKIKRAEKRRKMPAAQ